jgi:DegV family protein with EDD domain
MPSPQSPITSHQSPTVAIVTDSTACIPQELAQQYGIEIVPLHLILGGRTFVDSLTTDTSEFYRLLANSGDRPTTAAPSPGMFLEAITRAARRADAVLCITVSAQFSAMYDAARQAIEIAKAKAPQSDIRLLDSRNAAMAQGFIALEAARVAAAGGSIGGVAARAEAMTGRVTLLAMLDTLAYLARSGRVPRVAAWTAGMLQLKPIVQFSASGIKLVARTRTRHRALDRMLDLIAADTAGRPTHLAVHHANAPDDADRILLAARQRLPIVESHTTEFTQVMGVHTGPGLVALAWYCD